jgi:hypothetical protein
MYQLLKQIAITGIKTEAPAHADEALRVVTSGSGRNSGHVRRVARHPPRRCRFLQRLRAEIAYNNPYYNIQGLGIKFRRSPRHADLLLVTGRSRHMEWR